MKLFGNSSLSTPIATCYYDLLRLDVEKQVPCHRVIAVTSLDPRDGREAAARGLAHSLATADYKTALVDASQPERHTEPVLGLRLEDIVRQLAALAEDTNLATLSLGDTGLPRTASHRSLASGLRTLSSLFDYTIIAAGAGTPFEFAFVTGADAVLVTVRKGRREQAGDHRLAATLERLQGRFLGVLSLESSLTKIDAIPINLPQVRRNRNQSAQPLFAMDAETMASR